MWLTGDFYLLLTHARSRLSVMTMAATVLKISAGLKPRLAGPTYPVRPSSVFSEALAGPAARDWDTLHSNQAALVEAAQFHQSVSALPDHSRIAHAQVPLGTADTLVIRYTF